MFRGLEQLASTLVGTGNVLLRATGEILSRHIDIRPVARWVWTNPESAILIAGVALRLAAYLWNRAYWMDEGTLHGNIEDTPIYDFSTHLRGDQLAPFGFLIIERMLVRVLGDFRLVTRLVPLGCGIASLWLFRSLAFRWLSYPSAVLALALFAFSDDLVYYSSELKPYSVDLAIGLAILLSTSSLLRPPSSEKKLAIFGLLAVAAPWFSFPSAFIIVGCGLELFVDRTRRRAREDQGWLLGIAVCWSASACLAYIASTWLLNQATTMYVFWNFAFLPMPPTSRTDLVKFGGIVLEMFVNPLNLVPPFLPALGVVIPLGLWLLGGVTLARRDRALFLILVMPIVLAMGASALRKYPFHGRLLLPLVPAFYLMIAEGTGWIRDLLGRRGYLVALTLLLLYPCLSTLYEATGKRARTFNAHGDLHANLFMP
jgi:hypothetical protein